MSSQSSTPSPKPTRQELLDAIHNTVPDLLAPNLKLLLVGINPGLYTAWARRHFAHPGNRFWPALYAGGIIPEPLVAQDNEKLLQWQIGITNMVARPTVKADELTKDELKAGGERLVGIIDKYRPRWVAILGVSAYRIAFDQPKAQVGRQEIQLHGANVWVLPNPSGLNAHYTPSKLTEVFGELSEAVNKSMADTT